MSGEAKLMRLNISNYYSGFVMRKAVLQKGVLTKLISNLSETILG